MNINKGKIVLHTLSLILLCQIYHVAESSNAVGYLNQSVLSQLQFSLSLLRLTLAFQGHLSMFSTNFRTKC